MAVSASASKVDLLQASVSFGPPTLDAFLMRWAKTATMFGPPPDAPQMRAAATLAPSLIALALGDRVD